MATPIHALLIDDDLFNLEVLTRFLTNEGITCTSAQDLRHVRSIMTALPKVDLVFLDLEMPYMDGFDLYHVLRDTLGVHVPIIACTVHMNEISKVRELGFDGFVGKPLDQKRFPEQVKRILQGEPVWDF